MKSLRALKLSIWSLIYLILTGEQKKSNVLPKSNNLDPEQQKLANDNNINTRFVYGYIRY